MEEEDTRLILVYSHASLLEATSHAEFLNAIHPETGWNEIVEELNKTGVKIHNFIDYVENHWKT